MRQVLCSSMSASVQLLDTNARNFTTDTVEGLDLLECDIHLTFAHPMAEHDELCL
jgi:hypothetical protein